jgi:hypothetical protein
MCSFNACTEPHLSTQMRRQAIGRRHYKSFRSAVSLLSFSLALSPSLPLFLSVGAQRRSRRTLRINCAARAAESKRKRTGLRLRFATLRLCDAWLWFHTRANRSRILFPPASKQTIQDWYTFRVARAVRASLHPLPFVRMAHATRGGRDKVCTNMMWFDLDCGLSPVPCFFPQHSLAPRDDACDSPLRCIGRDRWPSG